MFNSIGDLRSIRENPMTPQYIVKHYPGPPMTLVRASNLEGVLVQYYWHIDLITFGSIMILSIMHTSAGEHCARWHD